jgi:stage III sporulation protein SpoIIIAA
LLESKMAITRSVSTRAAADEFARLLEYLPEPIRREATAHPLQDLVEIVLDQGRPAQLRYPGRFVLLDHLVEPADLEYVMARTGEFRADNRAGVPGTLHRISAIRDRYRAISGITMRVGRHLPGAAGTLRELLTSGRALLFVGPPGSGKTTVLRDAARILADEAGRRVVVVDTSNEIGGDGVVPHPAIGTARRMQVPDPAVQYQLLLEAVKNHTPEVIIIDEIGTREEAEVARSIGARGIQLIATAHGHTLRDLVHNPALAALVGGVQPAALASGALLRGAAADGGALQRAGPPAFAVVLELSRDHVAVIHRDVAASVDALLAGGRPPTERIALVPSPTVQVSEAEAPVPAPAAPPDDAAAPAEGAAQTVEGDPWLR